MFLVNSDTMRHLDTLAQEKGIPSAVLMENAATATVSEILKLNPESVIVFCGKGQNGGDGYAIARRLHIKGTFVKVCALFGREQLSGAALQNYDAFLAIGGKIIPFDENGDYSCTAIVDCLLGTGAVGNVRGDIAKCIKVINSLPAYKISADLPSGISADTGEVLGDAVKADKTVCYGFYKEGLFSPLSKDYTGEIILDDVSIPKDRETFKKVNTRLLISDDVYIPKISKSAHKGECGRVLIAGGQHGMTGAVMLAAEAAANMGAGLLTLAVPTSLMDIFMSRTYTSMCTPVENVDFSKFNTVAIGNGMGTGKGNGDILERAIKTSKETLIIDADGINLLSQDINLLKKKNCEVILTPHPLEFSRLTGISTEEIQKNRVKIAKEFSKEYSVTLILKSSYTVVSLKDGSAYINSTGNEGMAKGGSGDVLSGMLAGIAHRYPAIDDAAISAVYMHSLAGNCAALKCGTLSMNAKDIVNAIPEVTKLYN